MDHFGSTTMLGSNLPQDSAMFWKMGHTSFRCVVGSLDISSTHANVEKQMFGRISAAATPTKSMAFSNYPEIDWCPQLFSIIVEKPFGSVADAFIFMLNLYGKKN